MCQAEFILLDLIRFLKARGIGNTDLLIYGSCGLILNHTQGREWIQRLGLRTTFNWFSGKYTWPVVTAIRVTKNLHTDSCA